MIGYYAHHHGAGHVQRAAAIARHLRSPVTGLSSRPAPAGWPGDWIELASDADPAPGAGADVTAGGALHWAPAWHTGLRTRMAQIAAFVERRRPALLVVDVSVEVAAFARLMGVPVVLVAQPGTRADAPHRLARRLADAVLAPWPEWAHPRGDGAPRHHVGAFSRFDGRPRPHRERAGGDRHVLVLGGAGGTQITASQLAAAQAATRGWRWRTLGPPGADWTPDPWPALCEADVVVTAAGQNAVAEVAAARGAAIVLPQDRPFGEQHETAAALERAGLAVTRPRWPQASEWPGLLADALARGGGSWSHWAPGDGAQRAAGLLDAWTGLRAS